MPLIMDWSQNMDIKYVPSARRRWDELFPNKSLLLRRHGADNLSAEAGNVA